jgi:WD40 repeat protein
MSPIHGRLIVGRLWDSFVSWWTGDDIFLSYGRQDATDYSAALARGLADRGFACRYDQWSSSPGEKVPPELLRDLRRCRLLVVIGTRASGRSQEVADEICTFLPTGRQIIPIDADGSLRDAIWWNQLKGLHPSAEDPEAWESAKTSKKILDRIENTFHFARKSARLRRTAAIALTVTVILLLISIAASRRATSRWRDAQEATATAAARRVVIEADRMRVSDHLDTGTLLALAALDIAPIPEARAMLLTMLQQKPQLMTHLVAHKASIHALALSPDGRLLASGGDDNQIYLWDLTNTNAVRTLTPGHAKTSWRSEAESVVDSLAFSPDSRILASGGRDNRIILWDLTTFKLIAPPLVGHEDNSHPDYEAAIYCLTFSKVTPSLLASCGSDNVVILWDLSDPTRPVARRRLGDGRNGHVNPVSTAAFHPSRKILVTGAWDSTAIVWDYESGQILRRLVPWKLPDTPFGPRESIVDNVAFSPDGRLLATSGSKEGIALWSVDETGISAMPVREIPGKLLQFSADGQQALTSDGKKIVLWDVATWTKLGAPISDDRAHIEIAALGWHSQQEVVYSGVVRDFLYKGEVDTSIRVWQLSRDTALGRRLTDPASERGKGAGLSGAVKAVRYSGDGSRLLSASAGSESSGVAVWSVPAYTPLYQAPKLSKEHGEEYVNVGVLRSDGTAAAASVGQSSTFLWDISERSRAYPRLWNKPASSVKFSAGVTVALKFVDDFGEKSTIRVFDGQTRALFQRFDTDRATAMALSGKGQLLAVGGWRGDVRVLSVETGRTLNEFRPHTSAVRDLAFSPDAKRLASCSRDSTLAIWDLARNARDGPALLGHDGEVGVVSYSPDGMLLASGGNDGTVRLWDSHSGFQIGKFDTGPGKVTSLAFRPDGLQLASGGGYMTLWIYDLDLDHWKVLGRQLANRELTSTERERFVDRFLVGGEPTVPTVRQPPVGGWPSSITIEAVATSDSRVDSDGLTELRDISIKSLRGTPNRALSRARLPRSVLTGVLAADALAELETSVLILDGIERLTAKQESALEEWYGDVVLLDDLTELSVGAATALSKWAGRELSLNGLQDISTQSAAALSQASAELLYLDGLTVLRPEVCDSLAQWRGRALSFRGLTSLDADCAVHLGRWEGNELHLEGLVAMSTEAVAALAKWTGEELFLDGLRTLSPDVAREVARWDSEHGHLRLNGLSELPEDVAGELKKWRGSDLHLDGLQNLSAQLAHELAQWSHGFHLHLSGIRSLSQEAARELAGWRGRKNPVYTLTLDGLHQLMPETARELAAWEGYKLSLDGLATLDVETARELSRSSAEEFNLNGIETLDSDTATALLGWGGKSLHLNGLKRVDSGTARALGQRKGRGLELDGLAELSDEAVDALAGWIQRTPYPMLGLRNLKSLSLKSALRFADLQRTLERRGDALFLEVPPHIELQIDALAKEKR